MFFSDFELWVLSDIINNNLPMLHVSFYSLVYDSLQKYLHNLCNNKSAKMGFELFLR